MLVQPPVALKRLKLKSLWFPWSLGKPTSSSSVSIRSTASTVEEKKSALETSPPNSLESTRSVECEHFDAPFALDSTRWQSDETPTHLATEATESAPASEEHPSSVAPSNNVTTSNPPVLWKSRKGRIKLGMSMPTPRGSAAAISPERHSVLDLATRLVGDMLDFDYTYIASIKPRKADAYFQDVIDPPTSATPSTPPGRTHDLCLLSEYDMPQTSPTFSVPLHLALLTSPHPTLIYNAEDVEALPSGELVGGMLWRIDDHHVIGGLTTDRDRVWTEEDRAFLRRFARDMRKWTADN